MDYNKKKTIKDLDVKDKKALVRVDFNVPLDDAGDIIDDNRITAALPTIKYLVQNDAKVILFSHLGRIKTEEDKKTKSLKPVAKRLEELMGQKVIFVPETEGPELEAAINALKPGEILLVENTRFEDVVDGVLVKRESKNDPELGRYWASLGDLFINDAFGTAHRAHASNVGIATHIDDSAVGFLIEAELTNLAKGIDNPEHPFIAILGGAKVSDKIGVIDNLLNKVDKILIGGGMAYTFFAAQGHKVGRSLLEEDKIDDAKRYLEIGKGKIILPVDSANAPEFADVTPTFSDTSKDMPDDMMGLDIGPKTIELFKNELAGAKTVVWNGPMGVTEFTNFEKGTLEVGEAIANLPGAFTLIGGGDSAAAAKKLGLADKFSWISTGGGASLEYMEGKPLPGIEAIENK
ncbi:phosphoglycerate kinase [Mesoplasma lactucae]|uniref:Phosphoglycerate kinase n=1 Tax=Mesoplasma lactucae ATCC 49193 TaxID=81460 RepID=A0A291IS01_9MOLU|nr:phosphoglycerate kinase [Mesoplasma lactucae]ATG97553.1 phosphoglycerate kinase [Mesoplasma lactucae ATCC 49193]ATZ19988.1 phosphoglycerate kinase [Mesoplasma lactucae ATCC 49193]MCL8217061.1 Phosphoglycerate kinase [Mesoplasma lactucae ATCC 49193]